MLAVLTLVIGKARPAAASADALASATSSLPLQRGSGVDRAILQLLGLLLLLERGRRLVRPILARFEEVELLCLEFGVSLGRVR